MIAEQLEETHVTTTERPYCFLGIFYARLERRSILAIH